MSKPSAATRILALAALVASVAAGPADEEYLTGNAAQAGVTVLPSGLQYKVIASGPVDGPKPTPSQPCVCHYTGKLVSGYEFDSSRKRGRPATFKPSGVVKGWTEALQLMRPGDRWELVLPASLGYGERGAGGKIPGGATLIFDLELIEIAPPAKGLFTSMGLPFATVLDTPLIGGVPTWVVFIVALYILYRLGVFGGGGGGKQVSASHILVKSEERCAELGAELDAIKDSDAVKARFIELAKAESTCPSSAKGGALGTFGPGQMVPAFDKVCWSAPVGVVQGPVVTQFGSHLILVTDRTGDKKD